MHNGVSDYVTRTRALGVIKLQGEICKSTFTVGDFNTPLSPMDRSSKMKINKEAQALSDTLNKIDLIDIYRTFHAKTTEYTFFSSAHGTISR